MHYNISRRVPGLAFVALALSAGGCGSHVFDVTGKVNYNGNPLNKPGGQIVFIGPQGNQVVAEISLDGTYRASGVSSGLNHVAVYYPNPKAKREKTIKPKHGDSPPPVEPPFLTPFKYGVTDTSELSVTVEKETVFNVDLTGPAIP